MTLWASERIRLLLVEKVKFEFQVKLRHVFLYPKASSTPRLRTLPDWMMIDENPVPPDNCGSKVWFEVWEL